jgi:hypothetical protein
VVGGRQQEGRSPRGPPWRSSPLRRGLRAGRRHSGREEGAERDRLRSDPTALREHLRNWRHRGWGIERLGPVAAKALEITLERDEELAEVERRALLALGAMFADPLRLRLGESEPTTERCVFDEFVEHQRARQLEETGGLAQRFGEGPALRKARGRLRTGELLTAADASWLRQKAADDERSRNEQERLRSDYLCFREERARHRWKSQRIVARLRNGSEDFLEEIDRESLRFCRPCEEVAYPDPERARYGRGRYDVAFRCHFCDGRSLLAWEPTVEGESEL